METIYDIVREMRNMEEEAERQKRLCHSAGSCDLLFQANFEADKLKTENAKLKAALKPVLDFDFGKPRPGIVTCVHDATNAIVEAQRIYKEGESR